DYIERGGIRCAGTHLIMDLFGAKRLDDLKHIKATLKRCVDVAGASLLHIHLHRFVPEGSISGVAVLAEGHISIHSWPQMHNAALDVFMGGKATPHAAIAAIKRAFRPARAVVKEHLRADARRELGVKIRAKRAPARAKAEASGMTGEPGETANAAA